MGQKWEKGTWLQDESAAYPNGGQTRKGSAVYPDGRIRRVYAGIPDTWFTIPAHGRIGNRYVSGWVTVVSADGSDVDTGQARWLAFHVREIPEDRVMTEGQKEPAPVYGACGVEGCTDCLPLFDADDQEIES